MRSGIRILNHSGFGLAEILVATGLLSILSFGISQMIFNQNHALMSLRSVGSRDLLLNQLNQLAGNTLALTQSANYSGNTNFKNCVLGSLENNCIQFNNPNDFQNFSLTDQNGKKVAGPPSSPVYYDVSGTQCTKLSSNCFIEAISQFQATCANSSASCTQANTINVFIKLQMASAVPNPISRLKTMQTNQLSHVPLSAGSAGTINYISKFMTPTQLGDSIIVEKSGNIGIGVSSPAAKLDVSGGIKPGNQNQVINCDSTLQGLMRFNTNTQFMEYCSNNTWTNLQGPQGVQGPQGPQGVQGSQGTQGPQGVQGPGSHCRVELRSEMRNSGSDCSPGQTLTSYSSDGVTQCAEPYLWTGDCGASGGSSWAGTNCRVCTTVCITCY